MLFTMHVPKVYWGDAIFTIAYLINRMPLTTLNFKTPWQLLIGVSSYTIPPKVFGYTCYVWNHSPTISKLDPRALKCIFIRYSTTQKGYKCYHAPTQKFFVSMDVIFREHKGYFQSNLSPLQEKISVPRYKRFPCNRLILLLIWEQKVEKLLMIWG